MDKIWSVPGLNQSVLIANSRSEPVWLVFNWLYKTGFSHSLDHRDGKRKVPAGTPQKEITIGTGTATRLPPVK